MVISIISIILLIILSIILLLLYKKEKKKERYSEVIDEYYRYANAFPDGKHIKEANRILREAKNMLLMMKIISSRLGIVFLL